MEETKPGSLKNFITIGEYEKPKEVGGWSGWVEPHDKSWIIWFDEDHRPTLYNRRREPGGGVIEKVPEDRIVLPTYERRD